jgi:hypothetical protein
MNITVVGLLRPRAVKKYFGDVKVIYADPFA